MRMEILQRIAQIFCICLIAVAPVCAQTETKSIIQRLTLVKYPVDISFQLNGEPLKFKESVDTQQGIRSYLFEADADWLNQLTVKLKNTTDKTIIFVVLNLHFIEVTKDGSTALRQIFLGVDPDHKFARPELRLLPNQTLDVELSKERLQLKTLVEKVGGVSIESISKVWVEFHAAIFDNETMFEAGGMYRRDPDTQKFVPVDKP